MARLVKGLFKVPGLYKAVPKIFSAIAKKSFGPEAGFTSEGVPVLITEFGAVSKENEKDRAEWASAFLKKAEGFGMRALWWDNGGEFLPDEKLGYYNDFGLYDRFGDRWMFPAFWRRP